MIITCEACGTSFRLKTGRVKETGSKVRCSKCQHVFVVYPPAALADKDAVSGVEGTATMEFFGALEAEARSAREDEARRRREGDTINDLEALSEREGGPDQFFDEPEAALSAATADLSLSELEYDKDQDLVSHQDLETSPQMEAVSGLGEWSDDKPVTGETGGASSVDDWSVVEDTLDIENLTAEPEAPAVSTHEFAEVDAEAVSAQDEGVYGLADLEEPAEETREKVGEIEPEGIIDFSELTKTSQETLDFEDQDVEAFAEEEEEQTPAAEIEPQAGVDDDEADQDVGAYTVMADSVDFREASEDLTAELEDVDVGEDQDLELDLDDNLAYGSEELDGEFNDTDEAEIDLDLDFGEEDESPEPELDAITDEFDLDLDLEEDSIEEAPGGKTEAQEALDPDHGTGEEPAEPVSDTFDGEDWALDVDEFDLDLDEEGLESVDLDSTEFDLDFDLVGEEPAARKESSSHAPAEAGLEAEPEPPLEGAAEDEGLASIDLDEEDLDLDFDFEDDEEQQGSRSAALDEEEDFELEFDLGEEDSEGAVFDLEAEEADTLLPGDMKEDGDEFELDFDLAPEEGTVAGGETQEGAAARGDKTEEFDLSEIEDFLDEEPPPAESGQTMEESAELELELESSGQTMDAETEPRTATNGKTEEELDLETMMENKEQWREEEDTEISLETIDEQEAQEDEERAEPAPAVASGPAAEGFQITPAEDEQSSPVPETTFKRKKKSKAKPFFITLLILILLCALAVGGLYYFGFADRVPYLRDLVAAPADTAPPETAQAPPEEAAAEQETGTPQEAGTDEESATGEEAVAAADEAVSQGPPDAEEAGGEAPGAETAAASSDPSDAKAADAGEKAGASAPEQAAESGPAGKETAAVDDAAASGTPRIAMVENPYYRFVENQAAGQILVISGMVTNRYDAARQAIEVQANIFDDQGEVVRSNTVVAGNMLSERELESEGLAELKEALSGSGENSVPAGERLPFMVVFGNLPPDAAEFEVEVVSSGRG